MRKRAALITLILLVGLVAIPVVLTCFQVQHERLNQALIAAVDANDTAVVRRVLKQGADPNAQVLPDDNRPAWRRMWDLLRHRSSPVPTSNMSVLSEAIVGGTMSGTDYADTVQALAGAGADVNSRFISPIQAGFFMGGWPKPDQWLTTPLIWAVETRQSRAVKVLLTFPVDVNVSDGFGTTALIAAVDAGQADLVAALLQRGANINARDANGQTILFHSVQPTGVKMEKVRATVACLLHYGASVEGKDRFGNTALSLARLNWQDKPLIQILKHAGAK